MMKKTLLLGLLCAAAAHAKFGEAPANWSDFRIGLVNDNTAIHNTRMLQATQEGVKLAYRYRYLNGGIDSTKNSMSWSFSQWTDYCADSPSKAGTQTAWVVYMLQEEGGNEATKANANDAAKVQNYLADIRSVVNRCKGQQSVYVIEPDTWGYLMQNGSATDKSDPCSIPAKVKNLGPGWEFLNDLPDNLCGLVQATIRTVHYADPGAYAGVLVSHWGYVATGWNANGLVWSPQNYVDQSAAANVAWYKKLLGSGNDRGDFIGVEKNGYSAGKWKSMDATNSKWYWGDTEMQKYLSWSGAIGKGLDLPVLGWQISVGHMGLPNKSYDGSNTNSAYEDTFFPYFFGHVQDFLNAGFIGFLVGKGLADDTDFSNESEGASAGDGGWFFSQLKQFDKGRPYITKWGTAAAKSHFSMIQGRILEQNGSQIQLALPQNSLGQFRIRNSQGKILQSFNADSERYLLETKDLAPGAYLIEGDRTWISFQKH